MINTGSFLRHRLKAIGLTCLLFCILFSLQANNVRMDARIKVTDVSGGVATLEFPLQWDNSWHDAFNWDAVWIFLKYKKGSDAWKHIVLQDGGHAFSGDFTYTQGKTDGNVVGLFVYHSVVNSGDASTVCTLKWKLPSDLADFTIEKYENNDVFLKAQAIEMVYIPYGAYALGDGVSTKSFIQADTEEPVVIDAEDEVLNLEVKGGGTVMSLSAAYPKGFSGFYVMKYEVSQEQYVKFLNTLTLDEQKALLPGVTALSEGQYIFGSPTEPTNRNGIILSRIKGGNEPYIFANNLTNDAEYGTDNDGRTLACNFLSISDLVSYCSWAGLRPMSELEYEKACRQLLPKMPLGSEYAWGSTSGIDLLTAVHNSKTRNEIPQSGNVNAAGSFTEAGPVRCGAFAALKGGRTAAGATFWGVMEMSGNVRELCVNTNGNLSRDVHGTGNLDKTRWGTVDATHFGLRGGSFAGSTQALRVSDRSEVAGNLIDETTRENTVGFRAVRMFDTTGIRVNPGVISAEGAVTSVCVGTSLKIGGSVASSSVDGLYMKYAWYVNDTLIPNADQAEIVFNGFNSFGSYTFTRKAICAVGEAVAAPLTIKVVSVDFSLTPDEIVSIDQKSLLSNVFAATPKMAGGTFTWSYNGAKLTEGVIVVEDSVSHYGPQVENFGADLVAGRVLNVDCQYKNGGCISDVKTVQVTLSEGDLCGKLLYDKRDGKTYRTVRIGEQCWLADNMNVGELSTWAAGSTYGVAGIQRKCYGNLESNCSIYGGLYQWKEVMYAENTNAHKMNGTHVQGICPDGWHIPTRDEWHTLEMSLGVSRSEAYSSEWRGASVHLATKMKVAGTFNGTVYCSGSLCNQSGFNAVPAGYNNTAVGYSLYVWTTEPNGSSGVFYELTAGREDVQRDMDASPYYMSARCLVD